MIDRTMADEARIEIALRLRAAAMKRTGDDDPIWVPLPGPQTEAYESEADELYYGGAAGGGKTDLVLGLAATQHRKSIIFRREYPQLRDVISRSRDLLRMKGSFNGRETSWRLADGAILEFGATQYETDVAKYQGRPHDFKGFDELPQFSEAQYRFLIGWARTVIPGQRVRVVGAGNPPTTAEGEWVIKYWAPWLDEQHPHPAVPGELRYFAVVDGKDIECATAEPFTYKGETVTPRSRTFIPARLTDNPYLSSSGYASVLQGMPEPLRSQMLYGDFTIRSDDDPWQVIPTDWVLKAQERWHPENQPPGPMTSAGTDIARGGKAQTVIAPRYGAWFAPLRKYPGTTTPDGPSVVALIVEALQHGGIANLDVIGVGASVFDLCVQQGLAVNAINFSEKSPGTDRTGNLHFINLRAYAYWAFREALDPLTGDGIALPPDRELRADLCAARWTMRVNGIAVEPKEDIASRLGRSPDCGDAVVLGALGDIVPGAPLGIIAQGFARGWGILS